MYQCTNNIGIFWILTIVSDNNTDDDADHDHDVNDDDDNDNLKTEYYVLLFHLLYMKFSFSFL